MTVGSDNPFPSVLVQEHVDPTNPAAGYQRLFVDTDHLFKMVDSAGTVTTFSTSGGAMATDALWDAAGDLAVGTGANTGAKLSIGAAGGAVSRVNGAVAWNSGTSFPTAATGDRYWRTDDGMEFYYDGTRWLSTQVFKTLFINREGVTTSVGDFSVASSATGDGGRAGVPDPMSGSDIYNIQMRALFKVNSGGTALGASHKWVVTYVGLDTNDASTGTVATLTVDSGSSGVNRTSTIAINALQPAGTLWYQPTVTKTGTPGTFQLYSELYYRIVET